MWEQHWDVPPSSPERGQVRKGKMSGPGSVAPNYSCEGGNDVLLFPACTITCFPCATTAREEGLEVLSETLLLRNLSSCPRTLVRLIAVSEHSKIGTISRSAVAKRVLSVCPWNQPSACEVIKAVLCQMNRTRSFFLPPASPHKDAILPSFLLVTTELLPCNLLRLHSFVFLQTVFERLHAVTSGKGMGTAHTHFHPGTRQQQWQIGLLFCLTPGVVSRERGFY